MGNATDYSTQLLQVFERTLPVEWTDTGLPQMMPHRIESSHVRAFLEGFLDCSAGSLRDGAIGDLHGYGANGQGLQTSGVGLAPDFNQFINLGLLCGHRVVLWDTVIRATFAPQRGVLDRDAIALRACELLALKPCIEAGAIVMLPHPGTWLERCQRYLAAVSDIAGLTPEFAGFLHSRALKDEGFNLHPYTVSESSGSLGGMRRAVNQALSIGDEEQAPLVDPRSQRDEDAMASLVFDARFEYLSDLDSCALHATLSQPEIAGWKDALAGQLRIPDHMESDADSRAHLGAVKAAILDGVREQNRSLAAEKAGLVGSGIAAIGGSIGVASKPYEAALVLGVISASVSFATAWIHLAKLMRQRDDPIPTIYQGFRVVKRAYDEQQALHERMQIPDVPLARDPGP